VDAQIATWHRRGLGDKRISNLLCVLRRSLRVAAEWGLIRQAPYIRCIKVDVPDPVYLLREEYRSVLAAMEPGFWRTFVLLLITTGLRFGEAAALRWTDLHLDDEHPWLRIERAVEHGIVDDPKTRSGRRIIHLIPETVTALRDLAKTHSREYIFSTSTGGFYRPNTCSHILRAACRAAGVREVTWHKLRHTCATDLLTHNVPVIAVKEVLGHASLEMTNRYAHVIPSAARNYMHVMSENGKAIPVPLPSATTKVDSAAVSPSCPPATNPSPRNNKTALE
jgi:integrase